MQEAAEAFEQEQRDEELRAQSEAGPPSEPHNSSEPGKALLLEQYDIDSDGRCIPWSPRSPTSARGSTELLDMAHEAMAQEQAEQEALEA
eukprot:8951309-Alexandrium_andersonii.AAC.1